jgi:hypothetical protein
MPYVYSTLSNDNIYASYDNSGTNKDTPVLQRSILIKGGAGIATKHLLTPLGIVTKVTDDELEHLQKNEDFQLHIKNGFIKFDKKKVDPEVAAADMASRDKSAPYVPEDIDSSDPTVAKPVIVKSKK